MSWKCCVYQSVILIHNIKKSGISLESGVVVSFSTPEPMISCVQGKLCNLGYKFFSQEGIGSWNRCSVFLFQDGADSLGASDHKRDIILCKQVVQSWLFLYAGMEDKYPLLRLQFEEQDPKYLCVCCI